MQALVLMTDFAGVAGVMSAAPLSLISGRGGYRLRVGARLGVAMGTHVHRGSMSTGDVRALCESRTRSRRARSRGSRWWKPYWRNEDASEEAVVVEILRSIKSVDDV